MSDLCFLPVAPLVNPPPPEAYYGLLTDPPGEYGRCIHGSCKAITLRGSPEFIERASNLFSSFGGESQYPTLQGEWRRQAREPLFHAGRHLNTAYFCMPVERAKTAVRLYLFAQLYKAKAVRQSILDEEGDSVGHICLNETDLEVEAAVLTETFWHHEVGPDYGVIPDYLSTTDLTLDEYLHSDPRDTMRWSDTESDVA